MSAENLESIIPVMNIMAQIEGTIAQFYTACAESFPLNREFWQRLAEEEAGHADAVRQLICSATQDPRMFAIGDLSPIEALEAFAARIEGNFEQLRMGRLTEDKALLVAYLIENTFVEGKYAEIIKLKGERRSEALEKLSLDSRQHRDRVVRKITEEKVR